MFTSHRTIKWIESLAEQELLVSSGERSSIDILTTKEEVLSVETASFMRDLYSHFEYLVGLFNARVSQPTLQVALARMGEGAEGFSLTRNEMRLTLNSCQAGFIQVACHKWLPEPDGKGRRPTVMFSALIEATFGTFHDVEWLFLGNRVTPEQVARHYLTEFIQLTRFGGGESNS